MEDDHNKKSGEGERRRSVYPTPSVIRRPSQRESVDQYEESSMDIHPAPLLLVQGSSPDTSLMSPDLSKSKSTLTTRSRSSTGETDFLHSRFGLSQLARIRNICCKAIGNYLERVFTFPLITRPISFARPPDAQKSAERQPLTPEEVEELVNLDEVTKDRLNFVYEERKKVLEAREKFNYRDVDLSHFPKWDTKTIERLKMTFAIFDATNDNLVDFEEFTTVLSEYGDKCSEEVRQLNFDRVDTEKCGVIDFEQFLTLVYNLTMDRKALDVGSTDEERETYQLGESLHLIDTNMTRMRNLDVVQQLQAGLF